MKINKQSKTYKSILDIACILVKFYLSCGTEDDLYRSNVELRDFLVDNGVSVTWDEEKAGHEWDFWDSQIKKVIDWLPLDDAQMGVSSGNVHEA